MLDPGLRRGTSDATFVTEPALPRPLVAWGMVAALFVAYILSFVDRMIIGLLVDGIKADLQITDTEVSLLQGAAFALFFIVAAIPIGRLVDRVHRTRAVAAGVAVWSVMTMVCGLVSSFAGLFVARMGVGVGEAVLTPAAYSIISDSFPRRRLGLAMGVFGLGSAVGAGLAFMIGGAVVALVAGADATVLPVIGRVAPWQLAFLIAGAPGILVVLLFLALPDPRHGHAMPPVVPFGEVWRYINRRGLFFWPVLLGVSAVNLSVIGTVSWLPAMLIRGHGLALDSAGYVAGTALIVGGLMGMVGYGWLMDRIGGGTPGARMAFCGVAAAVAAVAGVAFPLVASPALAAVLYALFFSAAAGCVSAAPSVLQQMAAPGMKATVASIYVVLVNIAGIGIGPSVTAGISDVFFPGGDGIRYAMAILAPAGYLTGAALFFVAVRGARTL